LSSVIAEEDDGVDTGAAGRIRVLQVESIAGQHVGQGLLQHALAEGAAQLRRLQDLLQFAQPDPQSLDVLRRLLQKADPTAQLAGLLRVLAKPLIDARAHGLDLPLQQLE
jgi:hypothetical protein